MGVDLCKRQKGKIPCHSLTVISLVPAVNLSADMHTPGQITSHISTSVEQSEVVGVGSEVKRLQLLIQGSISYHLSWIQEISSEKCPVIVFWTPEWSLFYVNQPLRSCVNFFFLHLYFSIQWLITSAQHWLQSDQCYAQAQSFTAKQEQREQIYCPAVIVVRIRLRASEIIQQLSS